MSNEAIQGNPIPEKYTSDRFKLTYADINSNGCVYIHELVDRDKDDFESVEEIAIDKAKLGCIVKILPVLEGNDPLRELLYAGANENKCPDLNVDGEYYEVKTPTLPLKRNKLSNCVKNGKEQAHNVIIRMLEKFHETGLEAVVKGRLETHQSLQIVEFKCCLTDTYYSYNRPS